MAPARANRVGPGLPRAFQAPLGWAPPGPRGHLPDRSRLGLGQQQKRTSEDVLSCGRSVLADERYDQERQSRPKRSQREEDKDERTHELIPSRTIPIARSSATPA